MHKITRKLKLYYTNSLLTVHYFVSTQLHLFSILREQLKAITISLEYLTLLQVLGKKVCLVSDSSQAIKHSYV